MNTKEKILILDFGSQYTQLIARRIREFNVLSVIEPYDISISKIKLLRPKGIILSGGPSDVNAIDGFKLDSKFWELKVPILGICYGMQLMVFQNNGKVLNNQHTEFGRVNIKLNNQNILFNNINNSQVCWMSHNDSVVKADEFDIIASTNDCPFAAIKHKTKNWYGVQFHPEVTHTNFGKKMISNFIFDICQIEPIWVSETIIENQIEKIKTKIKDNKAICALSGGVDSTVAAALVSKAIGKNLLCIFVDHGLLRKDELLQVKTLLDKLELNVIYVDAVDLFLNKLKGITDPEEKRKIIGNLFIQVFEKFQSRLDKSYKYLVQGTIYPDIIESGHKNNKTIKSHHNVGGLPKNMKFKLIEPLKDLFKDEVRQIGMKLGLPSESVNRQPFPGPGLAVRIMGDITQEKINILQEADYIFTSLIQKESNIKPWQYFAVLLDTKSVGIVGDNRVYGYTICLRAVNTEDAMSCEWSKIDYQLLGKISSEITNNIKEVNRVVYDITNKPPGTIEWE